MKKVPNIRIIDISAVLGWGVFVVSRILSAVQESLVALYISDVWLKM